MKRSLPNRKVILRLSADEVARLVALNKRLIDMEFWIFIRAQQLAEDHLRRCHCSRTELQWDDFEMSCTISYLGPEIEDSDNTILTCSFGRINSLKGFFTNPGYDSTGEVLEEYFQFNWYDGITEVEALASQRICWSFHDLHDHHDLTWTDILRIEGVWVDVHAIEQRITRFPELIVNR